MASRCTGTMEESKTANMCKTDARKQHAADWCAAAPWQLTSAPVLIAKHSSMSAERLLVPDPLSTSASCALTHLSGCDMPDEICVPGG
jgi:hypothetical protein